MATLISDGSGVPHATDYADLLAQLVTFASSNGWTVVENTSDKVVLQGEGSGSDEIFVAFQKYADVGADTYGLQLNGYTGYQSGYTFRNQAGAIQANEIGGAGMIALPLWNSTTPFWFIVSGRRIIVIAKVSTTYQMAYLGFCLPFASPNQYPYPLCIGGSFVGTPSSPTPRWSGTGNDSCMFWTTGGSGALGSLFTRLPGGQWYGTSNSATTGLSPYNQSDCGLMREGIDGDAVLTPIEIQQSITGYHNRLGELDGVYHISGFGQSAENIVTVGSDDYVVIPNVFRSSSVDYVAVKLV